MNFANELLGVQALRHHEGVEVEELLIRTLVTDDHPKIREHATHAFSSRPREHDLEAIQGHLTDYASNPQDPSVIKRTRRSLGSLNDLLAFSFRFELPGLDFVLGDPEADTGPYFGFTTENFAGVDFR